jgi:lantibiotic modifying enzyme
MQGSLGIAYALLQLGQRISNTRFESAGRAALRIINQIEISPSDNDNLLWGELGRIEILSEPQATEAISRLLREVGQRGFSAQPAHARESVGLLEGISGLGYGMLRAARPDLVPSVLKLEPPKSSI